MGFLVKPQQTLKSPSSVSLNPAAAKALNIDLYKKYKYRFNLTIPVHNEILGGEGEGGAI